MTPPWGVPASGYVTSPSSSTPACSHLPIRRSSTPSCTRLRRMVRSCPWSSVSKKLWMSTSSTQPPPIVISPSRRILREGLMTMGGGWVLEVDIQSFFDTLDHGQLRTILRKRVQDGVLLRLIGKWLHAGVLEEGDVTYPDAGTPQGGVISPLLANVVLHEVLDTWFENAVKPRLQGPPFPLRYADDLPVGVS